jgi:hypothetical protein
VRRGMKKLLLALLFITLAISFYFYNTNMALEESLEFKEDYYRKEIARLQSENNQLVHDNTYLKTHTKEMVSKFNALEIDYLELLNEVDKLVNEKNRFMTRLTYVTEDAKHLQLLLHQLDPETYKSSEYFNILLLDHISNKLTPIRRDYTLRSKRASLIIVGSKTADYTETSIPGLSNNGLLELSSKLNILKSPEYVALLEETEMNYVVIYDFEDIDDDIEIFVDAGISDYLNLEEPFITIKKGASRNEVR